MGGAVKRYLMVVAAIIAVLGGLAVWLKPSLDRMRGNVESAVADYARTHTAPGGAPPVARDVASHDWLVAVGASAKIGEANFSCVGAFKVTICDFPQDD